MSSSTRCSDRTQVGSGQSQTGRSWWRICLFVQLLGAVCAVCTPYAGAEPGSGPRGTVDQSFTTARPDTPTGVDFSSAFHAAGDEQGNPPYLRRMVIYPPPGMRYDTTVPDQCTVSDGDLSFRGPAACPPGSRLGEGSTTGELQFPVANGFVLDRYWHRVYVLNGVEEQIVLVESEGFTVVRGKFRPDGAIDWDLPTCFPTVPGADCVDEHLVQLTTATMLPPYTESSDGRVQSYATTPRDCPDTGVWQTSVELTWSDGSVDDVVTTQPCTQRKSPVVRLTGRKKQRIAGPQVRPAGTRAGKQRKLLSVKVTCENEPCDVRVEGKATSSGDKVKLKPQHISLEAAETRKLRLEAASRSDVREMKAALKRGAEGRAKIVAAASGGDGATGKDELKIKLVG
jgi:hypothetical protein